MTAVVEPSGRSSAATSPGAPRGHLGKVLYGTLFCGVIPAALALWAHVMSSKIPFPAMYCPVLGVALICFGVGLILSAFHALYRHGHGLPMNAFPPPIYVHQGAYGLTRDPIYVGFSIACLGAAIASGSIGGLWLVTPIVMMGCAAIVWGYERPDLLRRFGSLVDRHRPWLHLPADTEAPPAFSDRVSIYLLVLLPWLILYTATGALPKPADAFIGHFAFEHTWPVVQWTEVIYGSTYLMVLLVPLRAIAQRDLRRFACAGLASMAIVFPIYLTIPLRAPARAFSATDALGRLLMFERVYDAHGANAFPSYHFLWALLAGATLAHCGRLWRYAGPLWAIAIGISCITTGQHALIDVLAAAVVFPLVLYLPGLYRHLVRLTERLGNSYRASRVGPLRIINHGIYSGLAGFVGVVIIGALAGPGHLLAIAAVALCSMIGAALWAQIIEGSPRLLRPFGYYGAVVGAVVGACCAPLLGSSTPLMLAAFATAAPMIQAIGRLRCIVQGCCHGKPLAAESGQELGLRITHPSSRVCKLSPFAGMPIHPTPLYSIIGNLFITVPMIRLWMLHAPLTLLMGMYLLLAGFARFIEEAYRGEPQTRRIAGLPEYQWLAIVSVMTGAFVTALPCAQMAPGLSPWGVSVPTIALALAAGLFTAFAMSMDFPGSNRRFSRLTG